MAPKKQPSRKTASIKAPETRPKSFFGRYKKWIFAGVGLILLLILTVSVAGWWVLMKENVNISGKSTHLYIPTGTDYEGVKSILKKEQILKDESTFQLVADLMKYPRLVKPGRYKIEAGTGNYILIRNLRIGRQDPVNISFHAIRTRERLSQKIDEKLEMSADDFLSALNDPELLDTLGLTSETAMALFIPNTYNIYWNVKPRRFLFQMKEAFDKFWTPERRKKAQALKLTPIEVVILASIVQEETLKNDEKPRVAGVYLNRLRDGWKLDADPTVKFALGDFALKRLYHRHTKYDSPYNTYMYTGLPPGPITCPAPETIDAVLNHEKHDYFFFCARPDFSGYHDFAKDLFAHNRNADNYAAKLNEKKIR